MGLELREYSLEKLISLKKAIDVEINSRKTLEIAQVRAKVEKVAKTMGYEIDALFDVRPPKKKVHPKYRNPDEPNQTWTGRGRKAKWVEAALKAGKTLEDLKI